MEHLEFIDKDHFELNYHRKWATGNLSRYIDFCWETDFETLLNQHAGFSDVLFPNIGYTYLINLGSPFVMQLGSNKFEVKSEGFLPRHAYITCHHTIGNRLFGIKFKVCPIVFEKDVDFSEYRENIYPLAYLIDRNVVQLVKKASSFNQRVRIIFDHYESLLDRYEGGLNYVQVVTAILQECIQSNRYNISIEDAAIANKISVRTLQRYFRATTSFSSKQALQTIRIRQAVIKLTSSPELFRITDFGYYDYSHFYKHLLQFTGERYIGLFSPRAIRANQKLL
ncbi:AraC family transcriptional regulator [Segetibacter sp. 3557_3]|uniref:AraC family transcriptional regulator n=1 Tax=Segetibacter sp. 3557_3 TaxID=2547429 RepID=UPI0010589749|nr:helix-turn-helix domain-containing protein [Segetibacter sp. 3557_3]TDH25222.1 AraC family transcriptional regulator [Segetibacter sp. 3557_3]